MGLENLAQPLILFLCYVVRIVVMFRTMPIMATTIIPQQALVALCAVFLIPIFMLNVYDSPQEIVLNMELLFLLIKEVFLGMFLGLLFSLLFWVAQSVGFLIDNQRGASQAEGTDPLSGDRLTPFASLLFQTLAMLFFSSGAFYIFLSVIYESYSIWPVFSPIPNLLSTHILSFVLAKFAEFMALVIVFSAPILIVCFLSDFCLGLINRFAQQLNVFSLSMPIKSGLVLFILVLYADGMFASFQSYLPAIANIVDVLKEITHE